MKNLKLKVCGLNARIAEVDAVHPDYLGFIFWEPSSRFFNQSQIPNTNGKRIGVFVDAPSETILNTVEEFNLNGVQLHGQETPEDCAAIKSSGIELIKAVRVAKQELDFKVLNEYSPHIDYFLFDTGGKLPGGNGTRFDWGKLIDYQLDKPFFLSGGISPEHQMEAIAFARQHPFCIGLDVNSGFEEAPGLKKIEKLQILKSAIDENA